MMVRRALVWFVMSAALLGAAAWLTAQVTQVEGRSAFSHLNHNYEELKTWGAQIKRINNEEVVSVLLNSSDPDTHLVDTGLTKYRASVEYETGSVGILSPENDERQAYLSINIPAHTGAKFIFRHVKNNGYIYYGHQYACRTSLEKPEEAARYEVAGKETLFTIKPAFDPYGRPYYVTTFKPSMADGADQYVVCLVKPDPIKISFSKLRNDITYLVPGQPLSINNYRDQTEKPPFDAVNFVGYRPVDALPVLVGIAGAENLSLVGGAIDPSLYDTDGERVLHPGGSLQIDWSDLSFEQMRDILLVVIGTLVALGVTALVEGLRPFIDGPRARADLGG